MKNYQLCIFVLLTISISFISSTLSKYRGTFQKIESIPQFMTENHDIFANLNNEAHHLSTRLTAASHTEAAASLTATTSSQSTASTATTSKTTAPKKPGGPASSAEFNESPFVRFNQKFVNSTLVNVDENLKFFYNYTFPEKITSPIKRLLSNYPTNRNFRVIDPLTHYFDIDKDLSRLKITVTFPLFGTDRGASCSTTYLFVDDKLIGELTASKWFSEDSTSTLANKYVFEPHQIKGTVFNVRQGHHKVSIGIITNLNFASNQEDTYGMFLDSHQNEGKYSKNDQYMDIIDKFYPVKVNYFMEGEVLRIRTYDDK